MTSEKNKIVDFKDSSKVSDQEAEDDIADPNSPTKREYITRSLKIKVAAMPPLGTASDE